MHTRHGQSPCRIETLQDSARTSRTTETATAKTDISAESCDDEAGIATAPPKASFPWNSAKNSGRSRLDPSYPRSHCLSSPISYLIRLSGSESTASASKASLNVSLSPPLQAIRSTDRYERESVGTLTMSGWCFRLSRLWSRIW